MKNRLLPLLLVFCIALPSAAAAKEPALPLGLSWCQSVGEVLVQLPNAREMSDDLLDATASVWGVEGFVSAILDEGKLVGLRFRAFETPADLKKIKRAIERSYGEGGSQGTAINWAAPGGVVVQLKLQSEQVFVNFETAPGHCGAEVTKTGLSDQEKADAEALKEKKAGNWDPYADDVDKRAVEKKKDALKPEEEDKEDKKEEPTAADDEIDW